MAEPFFQFKQFRVYHHRDTLKVGTDGVLLGAWAEVNKGNRVLDIGTGTGLIALMLAQKAQASIDAIDISEGASSLAAVNFAHAPFADLRAYCCDLADWLPDVQCIYDLIVCNPPFFTHAQPPKDDALHLAKHTVGLSPATLFREVSRLLKPSGHFYMIFPVQGQDEFFRAAESNGFHIFRRIELLPLPDRPAKRLLAAFTQEETNIVKVDTLTIELKAGERGYTNQFRQLTRDFFIRF